jgi:hypothetical protein
MRKMLVVLIAGMALGVAPAAAAQDSGRSYDWQSGNGYNWHADSQGNTTIYGTNFGTGSTWSTRTDRRGNMNGYDSDMNYWSYDRSTGSYYNYGTGKTCTGSGALRTCF